MAVKFNPFTGQLQIDEKGSGGGASYIDGEVQNFSALPETLGSPAVDSAYLVREAEGTWLLNRKPAGIYIRTANTGTRASDWTYAGEFPDVFSDANLVIYNGTDSTKNVKFDASAIATATTRTITVPDKNITLDDAGDSRTPSSHSSSHASAGSDPLAPSDLGLGAGDDVTFNSVAIEGGELKANSGALSILDADGPEKASLQVSNLELFNESTGGGYALFDAQGNLTGARIYDLPDRSGELMLVGDAPTSHTHGNLTNDGKIGSTAGLPVVTTTAGAVTTLALGTAGQVLTVNNTADGVEFAAASGGVSSVNSTLADILSVSGSDLVADDLGADKLYGWDDSESKAIGFTIGSGLETDTTTLKAKITSDPTGVTGADAITNIMSLTQAEYDAIGSPNASTLYIITDP